MKKLSNKIRGIKEKKQWAVFSPDGYLQYQTISDTKKDAQNRAVGWRSEKTWSDYAAAGFTANKVLVDIKLR